MRLNPFTQTLFTDTGRLIKQLHCPYNVNKVDMDVQSRCQRCDKKIVDAHGLQEDALADLLEGNPDTCLKIDLDHPELRLTHD